MIEQLIKKNHSCRRFYHEEAVTPETLPGLINLARGCPRRLPRGLPCYRLDARWK